jgi:transcriptional regulator with XRE-family HTH domain
MNDPSSSAASTKTSFSGSRFGPLIRAVRVASGRSQVELTVELGASAARLCAVERGRQIGPSKEYVGRLASFLGATPEQTALLVRAAARDAVLLDEQRFLSACLDAAVLLSPQDLEVIGKSIEDQVATRMRLMRMGGQPTFVETGGGP